MGGGVGSQSLVLAKEFKHLHFVVQDREAVIVDAAKVIALASLADMSLTGAREQYWKLKFPKAIADGRVKLQGQCLSSSQSH